MSVPLALLRAFARQMPRLQAGEVLLTSQATALGIGAMKQSASVVARLQGLAAGGQRSVAQAASPEMLADMGIKVHMVRPDGD